MERLITKAAQDFLSPFNGDLNEYLVKIETKMEEELIKYLEKVQITATKKSDKYSLPFQHEIIKKLMIESYVPACFEFHRILRPIVKELLEKNVFKIRFYLHVETYDREPKSFQPWGGIKYSFRYFIHKNEF